MTKSNPSVELKPCPFNAQHEQVNVAIGNEPETAKMYAVCLCNTCGAEGEKFAYGYWPQEKVTEAQAKSWAIVAWNTRTPSPALPTMSDEMREGFEKWASTGDRAGPSLMRDGDLYRDSCVLAWWQAWQAALSQPKGAGWLPIGEAEREFNKPLILFDGEQIAIGEWYDCNLLSVLGEAGWFPLKSPTHFMLLPPAPVQGE